MSVSVGGSEAEPDNDGLIRRTLKSETSRDWTESIRRDAIAGKRDQWDKEPRNRCSNELGLKGEAVYFLFAAQEKEPSSPGNKFHLRAWYLFFLSDKTVMWLADLYPRNRKEGHCCERIGIGE